jgi:hypothetical protein
MKSVVVAVALLLCAGVASRGADAALLGDATISYSADRTVIVDGKSFHGRLFHTPGHERHEQDLLGRDIFILDAQEERGWVIVPSLKTYAEFPFPPVMAALASRDLTSDPVRQETVNGVPTTKYRVEREVDGSHVSGFLWVSPENILMKFDIRIERAHHGKPIAIAMELSHIKGGPQDPHLFTVPPGVSPISMDALAPLLGMIR